MREMEGVMRSANVEAVAAGLILAALRLASARCLKGLMRK